MSALKIFVNDLKSRVIFPFYIDNINKLFFGSIKKFKNKSLGLKIVSKSTSFDYKELKKITNIEYISNHEIIQQVINRVIKKIAAKTGNKKNNLFVNKSIDKKDQPNYVEIKKEHYDFDIIGNIKNERRYIYAIDIDPNVYLFKYIEQLQISFYLDEKNKMISGGVSWNWGNDNKANSTENIIERVYLNSIIQYFISRELKDISLDNIISIIDASNKNDFESHSFKIKWNNLMQTKIIQNSVWDAKQKDFLLNELFYSVFITLLLSFVICEELKIYFRHNDPQIYQPLLKKTIVEPSNIDNDSKIDFFELFNFVKRNYSKMNSFDLKKISNEDDVIQALIDFDKHQNIYFGQSIISYEIIRNSDVPFLDEDDDVFMNNNHLKVLFLLAMDPKIFGIHPTTHDFIKYNDLCLMILNIDFKNLEWNQVLDSKIDETICEWNYDYVSFINNDLSFLIVKNDNPINFVHKKSKYDHDANRKLFNNYFWAQIYVNAIIYKIKDIEQNFNKIKYKYGHLLRDLLYEAEKLHFDWYDDFYGLLQLKKIIKKIDQFKNLNNSITQLSKKINSDDRVFRKKRERQNIAFAFITASLFGVTDFLTTIYTILAVQNPNEGFKPSSNIATISIGIFVVLILVSIFMYTVIRIFLSKRKQKKGRF